MSEALCTLSRGIHDGIKVLPRWPSQQVCVSPLAWSRLLQVQNQLPAGVRLILTRGHEPAASKLGVSRQCFRACGVALFRSLYRSRQNEVADIFGANGHDIDGNHVDVSLELDSQRIRFLPLGVFTPLGWQNRRIARYRGALEQLKTALLSNGFTIHHNATEGLQIHCDVIR